MNALDGWQERNNEYLAATVAWLRLRLRAQASKAETRTEARPRKERGFFAELFGSGEPAASSAPDAAAIAAAAERMAAAAQGDPPPAALILAHAFGLSHFEVEVLLLCAAIELDTSIAALCAQAQDGAAPLTATGGAPWAARPYPTFALALSLFDDPAWEALSPERPLRFWRLIEISQPGAQPLTTSALRADERIVNYLKGLNYVDDRLAPFLRSADGDADAMPALPPSQQETVKQVLAALAASGAGQRPFLVNLAGPDPTSQLMVAAHAFAALGRSLYVLPAGLAPVTAAEQETLARLWQRESALLPVGLFVDAHEVIESSGETGATALLQLVSRLSGGTLVGSREAWSGQIQAMVTVDVVRPLASEQREAWEAALGAGAGAWPERLAGQFDLNLPAISDIAVQALTGRHDSASLGESAWQAALARTRPRMDRLAQRIDPIATWDDIVLSEPALGLLRQITAQVPKRPQVYDDWGFRRRMNRGLGISVLFSGESGTGKTMAAEVIANDLGLSLFRIDLSAVVSKYIGETEKNLRRVFDAAEEGGAILFFDEADALFGKRSEVKDSHDRYANIEINYLLQRMEAYRGLAILATNMKSALDPAFVRRLRFVVTFPFPGQAERAEIWRRSFPPETPLAQEPAGERLDFDQMARLNLTGGSIHNIAVNAAFMAAANGEPVGMSLLLDAARTEFRKLERNINEAEFRQRGN